MIIIYLIAIIILTLVGKTQKDSFIDKHAKYCSFITKAIVILFEKINLNKYYNKNLYMYYYSEKNLSIIKTYHLSSKIASVIIFLFIPIIVLITSKQGTSIELIFAIVIIVIAYKLPDINLQIKVTKQNEKTLYEFTRFTYCLSLYINSGLNIYQAFKTSIDINSISTFSKQARKVIKRSESGSIFINELVEFSNNINLNEINSLITILIQNIKNGGEIKEKINDYAKVMWNKRKNISLKKGEKASVKMVFPLTLGLIGVIIIIVTPAILLIKQI